MNQEKIAKIGAKPITLVPVEEEEGKEAFIGAKKVTLVPEEKVAPSGRSHPLRGLIDPMAGGLYQFASGTLGAAEKLREAVFEKTPLKHLGIPSGGGFRKGAELAAQTGQQLRSQGLPGLFGDVAFGLGQAMGDIPSIMALGPYGLAVHGALMGAAEGGPKGAAVGAVRGSLVHKTLQGIAQLPSVTQPLAFAGFGAATTPGGAEERAAGGLTWLALGLTGGGKKVTLEEFIDRYPTLKDKITESKSRKIIKAIVPETTLKDIKDAGGAKKTLDDAMDMISSQMEPEGIRGKIGTREVELIPEKPKIEPKIEKIKQAEKPIEEMSMAEVRAEIKKELAMPEKKKLPIKMEQVGEPGYMTQAELDAWSVGKKSIEKESTQKPRIVEEGIDWGPMPKTNQFLEDYNKIPKHHTRKKSQMWMYISEKQSSLSPIERRLAQDALSKISAQEKGPIKDVEWETPKVDQDLSNKNTREVFAGLPITKETKGLATTIARKFVDTVQIEPQFKRIKAPDTGNAIRSYPSRQNMELEKSEILAKDLSKLKLNKWDFKEVTFAAASEAKLATYEPKYRAKISQAVKKVREFFNDWEVRLKKAGVFTEGFPANAISELTERRTHLNELLKTRGISAESAKKIHAEINEINQAIGFLKKAGIKYVHIPKTWLEGLWVKDPTRARRILTEFFRDRKTFDMEKLGKYLVEQGYISVEELDIRRIMAAYAHQAGHKLALAEIFRTAEREGIIKLEGKASEKWQYLPTRNYPSLKGKKVHPVLADFFERNFTNVGSVPKKWKTVWKETLGITKMLQFYNPIFLPMYDVVQAWWTGSVRSRKTPRLLWEALKTMKNKDQDYWDMHYWGAFSTPFKPGFETHMRRVKEIVDRGNFFKQAKKYLNPSILYRLSWKAAWWGDHAIRSITYKHYLEKGFSPQDAAGLTAKAHGDYASIPPSMRKKLNMVFFTPSFKIAMMSAQTEMIKDAGKLIAEGAKGRKIAPREQAMAKMLVGLASGILMRNWMMEHIFGFKVDKYGLKYSKTVETDEGQKELVLHTASPDNVFLRFYHRFYPKSMATEPDKFDALVNRSKWELHPLYQWGMEVLSNNSITMEPIYNVFDEPATITKDVLSYTIKRFIRMLEVLPGMNESQKRLAAYDAMQKDMGKASIILGAFSLPYLRNPEEKRIYYKAQALKREFTQFNREKPPRSAEEADKRLRRFLKKMEELQKELEK